MPRSMQSVCSLGRSLEGAQAEFAATAWGTFAAVYFVYKDSGVFAAKVPFCRGVNLELMKVRWL